MHAIYIVSSYNILKIFKNVLLNELLAALQIRVTWILGDSRQNRSTYQFLTKQFYGTCV